MPMTKYGFKLKVESPESDKEYAQTVDEFKDLDIKVERGDFNDDLILTGELSTNADAISVISGFVSDIEDIGLRAGAITMEVAPMVNQEN